MDKRKILGVGTIVLTFFMSIVAVTVAFAAYTSNLTITGSATAKGAKWKVAFVSPGAITTGNDNGVTSTAKAVKQPSLDGDTKIKDWSVELQTPGDYVSFKFYIENSGDFPAKIDSGFSMPRPSCTKGPSGKDADVNNVCNNLDYTLTYTGVVTFKDGANQTGKDTVTAGKVVASADKYLPGEKREVELKLYYKKSVSDSILPADDVTISNLEINVNFVQA